MTWQEQARTLHSDFYLIALGVVKTAFHSLLSSTIHLQIENMVFKSIVNSLDGFGEKSYIRWNTYIYVTHATINLSTTLNREGGGWYFFTKSDPQRRSLETNALI